VTKVRSNISTDSILAIIMGWFKSPFKAQDDGNGAFFPSPFTLFIGVPSVTPYAKQEHSVTYSGSKPILVVCTDESLMEMENKLKFSTGNHPIEMLVPMLHFRDAGFSFEFSTVTGGPVKLEMWAFPKKDENVKSLYESVKEKLDNPKKLEDITSIDDYSAIFIPGGHGSLINLPFSVALGKILHMAHEKEMPTVTLCHGPGTLLSTAEEGTGKDFAYSGYELVCFTDKTDKMTPSVGYMPGQMPWLQQAALEEKGMKVLNKKETGSVNKDRELMTGDGPTAANALGKLAAPIVAKWANEHRA